MKIIAEVKFNPDGLVPAIIQEAPHGRVLMLGWMNQTALEETIRTGRTVFWSRSRRELWRKGDTSGHVQHVKDIAFDCDGDTLLVQVEQTGAACHNGYKSCFYRSITHQGDAARVTESLLARPEEIYRKP